MINHILLGFGISFIGSLPLGVLNITAIEVAVARRFYQVFLFALGVIIIEYGQAFIAIKFSDFLLSNPTVDYAIQVVVIPLFLVIGFFYMLSGYKKQKAIKKAIIKKDTDKKKVAPFFKGMMLSMINPLAIPYWLAVTTSLKAAGQLNSDWQFTHCFLGGIVAGTFTALSLYGAVGEVLEKKLKRFEKYFNSIIGFMLIGLGIWQIYRVFIV